MIWTSGCKEQYHQVLSLNHCKSKWVIFVKKQSKKGKGGQEEMRKRLEKSLPWSLSRWLAKMWRKRK